MQVILLENIMNLGNIGDKVVVKPGDGRNYLLKTGKTLKYNKENQDYVSKKKDELNKKNNQIRNKFKDIAKEFQEFVHEKKLVIHNADFDLAFLNKELKEAGYPRIPNTNIIDTLNVAREKFPGAQNSLDALCKRFKIDNSRRQKHSALLDCELLAKVYIELFEKKEPSFEFKIEDDDTIVKDVEDFNNREQLVQEITSEEKDLHRNFLKKDLPKSSMLN